MLYFRHFSVFIIWLMPIERGERKNVHCLFHSISCSSSLFASFTLPLTSYRFVVIEFINRHKYIRMHTDCRSRRTKSKLVRFMTDNKTIICNCSPWHLKYYPHEPLLIESFWLHSSIIWISMRWVHALIAFKDSNKKHTHTRTQIQWYSRAFITATWHRMIIAFLVFRILLSSLRLQRLRLANTVGTVYIQRPLMNVIAHLHIFDRPEN